MDDKKIITFKSLQSYFFDQLMHLNRNSLSPVPNEVIYYSSDVMDRYALSSNYFEDKDGKRSEKILGIKLLEAGQKDFKEQMRVYQDIGDTALLVCGWFAPSTEGKLVNKSYYLKLGQIAYERLHALRPISFDLPEFYKIMSGCFVNITKMIEAVSNDQKHVESSDLIHELVFENSDKKVS